MANDGTNHVSQSDSAHLQQPLHSPTSPQHQSSPQSQATNSQHQTMAQNSQTQQQQQHGGPQTPNTPTSIPEIIFTDFSATSELTKGNHNLFGNRRF